MKREYACTSVHWFTSQMPHWAEPQPGDETFHVGDQESHFLPSSVHIGRKAGPSEAEDPGHKPDTWMEEAADPGGINYCTTSLLPDG